MLFQSQIPLTFQSMNFQADNRTNLNRKIEAAKRLDFYHDGQLERLETQLNELFSDPSQMIKVELNIVRKIIDNLAQVYRKPPIRTIEGTEKDQTLYSEIVESCNLDVIMKQATRYTKLLKTIMLKPVWRNNGLSVDILTPNIIDIKTGNTPNDLKSVMITDYGNTDNIEDIEYSLWTPEEYKRLDYRGNVIETEPNIYGVLPFLPIWDYLPIGNEFFLSGGQSIISLQEAINLKLVDLLYLLSCQSFGVGYIKGSTGGGSMKVDPGSLVELGENGEIGFKSQQAQITQVLESIDKIIKWACVSQGLSASSMSTDPTEQSGISKIVDTKELAEMRTDDIQLFRGYEKQLFNLMRIVHNTHTNQKLSDSATLSIDFYDPEKESTSAKDQATTWDLELSMGIISQVDIVMQKNPDLKSREDALSYLLKIQEETKTLNSATQP